MTRRQLVSGAIMIGGIGAAGSAAASLLGEARAQAADDQPTDADLLGDLLAVELLLGVVYGRVIGSGLLSPRTERAALRVLAQEQTHAQALELELRALGRPAPASPAAPSAIDKALADRDVSGSIQRLRDEHDCGRLLLELEGAAQGAYFKAMSRLHDSRLVLLAAQIMANEAQHSTVISEARRPGNIGQAVPNAFVQGTT